MKSLKNGLKILLYVCFLCHACLVAAVASEGQEEWQKRILEKKRLELLEIKARKNTPFVFYGRVVDLEGEPVPDAEVSMRLSFSPSTPMVKGKKLLKTITDQAGRFSFSGTVYLLFLAEISKEGYQYHHKYIPTPGFRFHKGEKKVELGQFEDQPVEFKVRKKGTPTLVLTGGMSFQLSPGRKNKWILDLIGKRWSEPEKIRYKRMNHKDWSSDLQMTFSKEDTIYHLLFEGLDEGTGIVMGEPEQYVAPETGYQPTLVLSIPEDEKETERWLFLEGRGGEFYTMLRVTTIPKEKWLNLNVWYGTNPAGSRNLERSPELEMEYIKKKYGRD